MPLDLEGIRARCEAATEGPWDYEMGEYMLMIPVGEIRRPGEKAAIAFAFAGHPPVPIIAESNARFIAHAREDIPALIAEVERLRKERHEADL